MALSTFVPPVAPSPGTGIKTAFKLQKAEFGDGYSQISPDGINYKRKTANLAWNALTLAQANAIESFLENLGGHMPFYFQPYGFAATVKWTCENYNRTLDEGYWKMTAEFVQSFDTRT